MSKLSLIDSKNGFIGRLRRAWMILRGNEPSSPFESLIIWDPVSRKLTFRGDIEIAAQGTLKLSSTDDIVLISGHKSGEYTHAIWLNPDLEEDYVEGESLCERGSSSELHLQSRLGQAISDAPRDHGEDCGC